MSNLDWQLHAPMVFHILQDSKYLKTCGVNFKLEKNIIHVSGGWTYSPREITSFEKALTVIRDNGGACSPHFSAVCLLEGVSYHEILDDGKDLLRRLFSK